uniref:Uncharacterized protein n=1 Tax=Apophlaea sinclairii TaxID=212746 RepID=A0A1C9CBP1_9FLOR|nr:hypothetical protein Apop_102 [Apophlaea sinclairii]AOM65792.1 hypothetical protein Apop_102 [Apophlaea sinclairii]
MKTLLFSSLNSRQFYCVNDSSLGLTIHVNQVPEVWLFNCSENTQHNLLKCHIKLSLISKIFITRFNLTNISGLLGLLSTLNLDNHNKTLDIYGPDNLHIYLKLNSKYSQTNFSYPVKVHSIQLHSIFINALYNIRVITFKHKVHELSYIITFRQNLGKFNLTYAVVFNIVRGRIYGNLKQRNNFIAPDGHEIQGQLFSKIPYRGKKISIIPNVKNINFIKEFCWQTDCIIYTN